MADHASRETEFRMSATTRSPQSGDEVGERKARGRTASSTREGRGAAEEISIEKIASLFSALDTKGWVD